MAGPGEGGVGLGLNGSDWAQFGSRGSREVAFGRAWACTTEKNFKQFDILFA